MKSKDVKYNEAIARSMENLDSYFPKVRKKRLSSHEVLKRLHVLKMSMGIKKTDIRFDNKLSEKIACYYIHKGQLQEGRKEK
ncbi:MAG: hypothetical protein WDA09_06360 [Bacteriovoracaceae bacterium]